MINFPANTEAKPKVTGVEFTWGCSPALKKSIVFCYAYFMLKCQPSTINTIEQSPDSQVSLYSL